MWDLHGKDFLFTQHAFNGAAAEDLDERLIYDIIADHSPAPRLGKTVTTEIPKGRRIIIVRWVEREHAYYVLNVSARRR